VRQIDSSEELDAMQRETDEFLRETLECYDDGAADARGIAPAAHRFHPDGLRITQAKNRVTRAGKTIFSGVTSRSIMATIGINCVAYNRHRFGIVSGTSSVIASRLFIVLMAATAGFIALQPARSHAQWWSRAPADFEACADAAEKAATKEAKASALAGCNAKFAGRRKPGGGYTYFDFMQDRSFDIAGPNPTPEEQKKIDQEYTVYLDNQRRNSIVAAFAAKQQQQQQQPVQPAMFRSETEKLPRPAQAPKRDAAANLKARTKGRECARHSFSCEWPRLSESIKDLKKALFGAPTTSKAKRG
jgi:hypothetical protein